MNNNDKLIVYFDAVPINTAVDPRGGYTMKMKEQQIVSGNSVFEEVVLTKTLPFSAELLEFAFECVLTTMADRVSRDCRPRKVGKHLKAAAYLRGRLDSPYGSYNPQNHSCAIIFTSLSGVTKTANTDKYVRFVNTRTGTRVIIDRIVYEGCVKSEEIATIMRGRGIAVTGLNLQWLEGDSCTLVWTDAEGAEQTANIEPISSTVTEMHFAWPEALAAVPAGSKIEMRFLTRGGIAEADPQPNNKTVTLIEGELPPKTRIAFTGAYAESESYGVHVTNPEGLATFVAGTGGSDYDKLTVNVKVNGVGKGTLQLQRRYSSQPDLFSFDDPQDWTSGDEIEFSALRDPEKADDYEPEKVSATCTVP